jgi:hypothetical protein
MDALYILAPQAALDLLEIWRYLKEQPASQSQIALNRPSGKGLLFWPQLPALDIFAKI